MDDPDGGSAEAVAARLLLNGTWESARLRVEEDRALAALAARDGVVIGRDDVQAAVDDYRLRLGLQSKEQTEAWLSDFGLEAAHLTAHCLTLLQRDALLAAVSSGEVREWFEERRGDYDAALLSAISVTSEVQAWVVQASALASPGEFDDLAWECVQADDALPAGGALGWQFRSNLDPAVAAAVFADGSGVVAGPLLVGGVFYVYRVWCRRPAALTRTIAAECRRACLAGRVAAFLSAADAP